MDDISVETKYTLITGIPDYPTGTYDTKEKLEKELTYIENNVLPNHNITDIRQARIIIVKEVNFKEKSILDLEEFRAMANSP
jgi:hypothetical protein